MQIERQDGAVVVWAPAKVNLYLEVLSKRADGYHEIATFMVAVSLYDTLEFREDSSGIVELQSNAAGLDTGPENLIVRAVTRLQAKTGCTRGAKIRLTKRIPLAAGLAGGSTDAAATLLALNELWQLRRSGHDLTSLGMELGSDVPFFLNAPAAWCTGRGEKVSPMALTMPLWFVLLCPSFGLSTAEVYRGVQVPEQPRSGAEFLRAVQQGDLAEMGRRLHNRLQPVALKLRPALRTYLDQFERHRLAGHGMSGSGSSLFALCHDRREAQSLAQQMRSSLGEEGNASVFVVRSCA